MFKRFYEDWEDIIQMYVLQIAVFTFMILMMCGFAALDKVSKMLDGTAPAAGPKKTSFPDYHQGLSKSDESLYA